MKTLPKLFLVTGPTCTGKTNAVNALLKKHKDLNVICFDTCQIYDHFAIGMGRSDALYPDRAYLYGEEPVDQELPVEEFIVKLLQKYAELTQKGQKVFIEGGSRRYLEVLLRLERMGLIELKIIGLEPPNEEYMENRFHLRTEGFVESGILDEITSGLEKGYEETIKNHPDWAIVYKPFYRHLQGEISLEEAKFLVRILMKEMHKDQLKKFKQIPNISWITVTDPKCEAKILKEYKNFIEQKIEEHVTI